MTKNQGPRHDVAEERLGEGKVQGLRYHKEVRENEL